MENNNQFKPLTVDECGKLRGGFAEIGDTPNDDALYNRNCTLDAKWINNNCGCTKCTLAEKPTEPKPGTPDQPSTEG